MLQDRRLDRKETVVWMPFTPSVERQAGIPADVVLVDGPLPFLGDEETDDLGDFLGLDELVGLDVGAHLLDHLRGHAAGTKPKKRLSRLFVTLSPTKKYQSCRKV